MEGKNPTADEFAQWLIPPAALARLDSALSADDKKGWILRRLATGDVRAYAGSDIISSAMWKSPWKWFGDLWQTGDITFFDGPADIFGKPIPGVRCEKRDYLGLKFDPHGFPPPWATAATTPIKSGGRPGGHHGEPIARLTLRLRDLSASDLGKYTAEAAGADLIEEYRRLNLPPPSAENATRMGSGILRAVRN